MTPTDLGFVEGKHAVDDRPDLVLFHGPAQVLEIATAMSWNEKRVYNELYKARRVLAEWHRRDSAEGGEP